MVNLASVRHEDYIPHLQIVCTRANAWRAYLRIAIAVLLFCPMVGYATSIVAIYSNNTIVIAADSKRQIITKSTKSQLACKLHATNNFAWATSGFTMSWASVPGRPDRILWDVNDAVGKVAKTSDTPRSKIARLDELMPSWLLPVAEGLKIADPSKFNMFSHGEDFLEILLIGFQNGEVTISHREYGLDTSKGKIAIVMNPWKPDCPGHQCDNNPQPFFTGEGEALEAFLPKHPEVFRSTSPDYLMKLAISLVQMEISDSPQKVGPPIQTATFDVNGIHWGEDNTVCPNGKQINKRSRKVQKPTKTASSISFWTDATANAHKRN